MHTVIQVEQLSKQYRLGQISSGRLVDDVNRWWARMRGGEDPRSKIYPSRKARPQSGEMWALRDVSFEVKQGEVLGLIGRNGAGKSTALKILSRVTAPTKGEVRVKGRIASLLEVGTGFHPDLTGRENIFVNGAILGMTKAEIRNKFDEIVAFSEVEQFIDTPVKRYSSGMYVRLAFAVAAHLDPEILIVDEVLAVGDAAFQKKCLGKMQWAAGTGRTVLFVSHNMAAVTRFCSRALWFDHGRLRGEGNTEQMVSRYLSEGADSAGEITWGKEGASPPASDCIQLRAVRVRGSDGAVRSTIDIRHPFTIEVQYQILQRGDRLRVGIRLLSQDGTILLSSTDRDGEDEPTRAPGEYVSRCDIPGEFLNRGQYYVTIGSDTPRVRTHFHIDQALSFHVEQTGGATGHFNDDRGGVLRLRLPWKVERIGT